MYVSNKLNVGFSNAITLAPHLPTICEGVRNLSTPDEVKWAAIAMKGVCRLLSAETNNIFWQRVLQLIDEGRIYFWTHGSATTLQQICHDVLFRGTCQGL